MTASRVYLVGVAWSVAVVVAVVAAVTAVIEWRRPDAAVAVRAAVRAELAERDSMAEVRTDSIIARTDSIMALLTTADSVTAAEQRQLWLDLFRGLHDEHAAILANQAASRRREVAMHGDLINALCWWTGNRAAPCRGRGR